jgi:hypothetical protein
MRTRQALGVAAGLLLLLGAAAGTAYGSQEPTADWASSRPGRQLAQQGSVSDTQPPAAACKHLSQELAGQVF